MTFWPLPCHFCKQNTQNPEDSSVSVSGNEFRALENEFLVLGEMSFGLGEMSFGLSEMSFGHFG